MNKSLPLYVFVASVFLMLVGGALPTTGMFVDGITYGNVADNMATGVCTFWHPSHSPSLYPQFFQHPPLAMGLLALCYKALGVHVWVTRLFTMVTTLLTAWLTVALWRRMGYSRRTGWLPLLLWVLVPAMSRNAHDNMLECTMAVFTLAALLCLLHGDCRHRLLRDAAGGVCLFLAFMCKGFTGLYPLAAPLAVWVVDWIMGGHTHRGRALLTAVADVLAAGGTLAVCFGLTGLVFPAWVDYFDNYMQMQLLPGLTDATVSSRWTIVWKFLEQTAILWAVAAVAVGAMRIGRRERVPRTDLRCFWVCLTVALTGVLPIAVSLKQYGFYILTVYPVVAVGIGALVRSTALRLTDKVSGRWPAATGIVATVALAGAVTLNAMNWGKPGRDADLQHDLQLIAAQVDEGEQVCMPANMQEEWELYAYCYRAKHIDLRPVDLSRPTGGLCRHLIADRREAVPEALYTECRLPTQQYKLYELKQ